MISTDKLSFHSGPLYNKPLTDLFQLSYPQFYFTLFLFTFSYKKKISDSDFSDGESDIDPDLLDEVRKVGSLIQGLYQSTDLEISYMTLACVSV